MKPSYIVWGVCLLILLLLTGCSATPMVNEPTPAPTTPTPPPPAQTPIPPTAVSTEIPTATPEPAPVVLTLDGPDGIQTFTMDELKDMPPTSGQAGMKSSTGKITVPAEYTGVLLAELAERVGELGPEMGVNVVANDGYAMTLSYDQVTNGTFITYDPSDGSEKVIDDPLQALVAYAVDGQPLDAKGEGILRMVIISDKNNQVTDGHWSVKWVERIEVRPIGQEWSLSLDGIRDEVIDRNTFQSCGATSCHQSTWTDDEGQLWTGVPLYLLAGRMDDEVTHDGPAFNRELSNAGYQIELVAADGYTVTIDSQAAYYNRNILVANQVNDSPLPDKYFPLRLVGDDTEKGQRAGALTEIRLIIEEAAAMLAAEATPSPTIEPTPVAIASAPSEPPEGTDLWITGMVVNPLALQDDDLQALKVIQVTAEHPKKGPQDYEGIALSGLLNLAMPKPGATKLVLTAKDGYSTTVDLAAVQICANCLLELSDVPGEYSLVMPGFESSAWVKDLIKIEIQ